MWRGKIDMYSKTDRQREQDMTYYEAIHAMKLRTRHAQGLVDHFARMAEKGYYNEAEREITEARSAKWQRKLAVRTAALARLQSGLA